MCVSACRGNQSGFPPGNLNASVRLLRLGLVVSVRDGLSVPRDASSNRTPFDEWLVALVTELLNHNNKTPASRN
jgi:hypothetical protein